MHSSKNPQLDALKDRMGARVIAILEGYKTSSVDYLNVLSSPSSSKNDMIEAAHSLKSSSAILGLSDVNETCEKLERTLIDAQENELESIRSLVLDLDVLHKDSLAYIEREISALG